MRHDLLVTTRQEGTNGLLPKVSMEIFGLGIYLSRGHLGALDMATAMI